MVRILTDTLYGLLAERREPGDKYAWFVSVALQRIHGISPAQYKQRRTELQLVKKQHSPPEQEQVEAIQQQISGMAEEKRMRFSR